MEKSKNGSLLKVNDNDWQENLLINETWREYACLLINCFLNTII